MYTLAKRFLFPRSWGWIIAIVAAHTLATAASLYLPTLNARIIDDGIAKGDTDEIVRLGLLMLAVTLAQITGQITGVVIGARTAMRFGADIRTGLFHRTMSFSTRELQKFGAPSLITRTTNDVQQVQMLALMTLIMMVSAPITMVGGVIMAVREDIGLSWLIVIAVVVLSIAVGILVSQIGPLFQRLQVHIDALNRVLREQIGGIRVVRAFVREDHERRRFNAANLDIATTSTSVGRWMATIFPVVMLVMNASSMGVMWFGAQRITDGSLEIGQLTAFLQYLMQILMSVMMTTMMIVMAPRAFVSARRIRDVLETESSVVWSPDAAPANGSRGLVEFDGVSFAYPGADDDVLHDVSFTMRPGETTAIIGSTGSGKTTLVNLMPRLFDATAGTVRIDGIDVRDDDPDRLWAHIGLVPQKSWLFTGTVADNLRYGNADATDDELWAALDVAQARDFVEALPDQLDAPVAQGGTNFSGGQRQRLAIARAIAKDPDIFCFDDSFSALDTGTDARLRAALARHTRDASVMLVAQRVSSITHADQILVLEHGRIVGRGTHAELLAGNETYQEIVASQLSVEEAA